MEEHLGHLLSRSRYSSMELGGYPIHFRTWVSDLSHLDSAGGKPLSLEDGRETYFVNQKGVTIRAMCVMVWKMCLEVIAIRSQFWRPPRKWTLAELLFNIAYSRC